LNLNESAGSADEAVAGNSRTVKPSTTLKRRRARDRTP
jgi:hypothetical protein